MDTSGSRLQDPALAFSIYTQLRTDDREASQKRAKVDAMINGEEPFDQAMLEATGQGDAANYNTRESDQIVTTEVGAYYDLMSPQILAVMESEMGDAAKRKYIEEETAFEFTRLLRSDDSLDMQYSILTRQEVTHGVGIAFFEDETDFRYKSCGWADFHIPRDTLATESAIPIACAAVSMEISDLFSKHQAAKDTDSELWDLAMLRSVIQAQSKEVVTANQKQNWDNWEYVEQAIKENAAGFGAATGCKLRVVHFWIREEDGTITHAILPDKNASLSPTQNGWLYFNKSRFSKISDAIIVFPYKIPISGTYHAIRGLGWTIQPQVQAKNNLECRMADGAMAATMTLLQVINASQTDMDRLSVAHFGNNEVLPAGLSHIDRKLPDYTQTILPVSQHMDNTLRRNNTGARPSLPSLDKNSPDFAQQVEIQNNASLSASALNRHYLQMDKLFTAMFKRAIAKGYSEDDGGGDLVKIFRDRLLRKGIGQDELDSISDVKMTRTVGGGSAANRLLSLQRLERRMGSFDPEGRRNLIYDITAEEVGPDKARRYIEPVPVEQQRQPLDAAIAQLENATMGQPNAQDYPIVVLPNQDHFTHVQTHLPPLVQRMDQLDQLGENAPMEALIQMHGILMVNLPHIASHTNFMAYDISRKDETKGLIKITQELSAEADRLRAQIERQQKAEQAAQEAEMKRQQDAQAAYVAELEAKVQQGGPDNSKAQAMLMQAQVKTQIMAAEHAQRIQQKKEMWDVEKAVKDARATADAIRDSQILAAKLASQQLPKPTQE